MSSSSNKQQKKGKDGMGKGGKRKDMVKDWCGASCVWKSKCEYVDKLCVRCVCVRAEVVTGKEGKTKEVVKRIEK